MSAFEKFKCSYCSTKIEYKPQDAGAMCNCPNCKKEIQLPVKRQYRPTKIKRPSQLSAVFVCLIGIGLLFFGVLTDSTAENSIQQIYAAIEFCTGWLIVALSVGISIIITIAQNQAQQHDIQQLEKSLE